ncbi:MetQ/NlpA family ABC transporter substrate-binding protein [Canibacter zhoujuaniae]|uniref:MetQ/NlpA family ABC transporter substrate-binding protein n=1 Tax=Canibacter zhoujuaniae TaxID=2708343 RepID=UPI0014243F3A|nr:MetQ/NlpA family ABC transporter substrate-binding protein [Canibacter zhoujuaniae]
MASFKKLFAAAGVLALAAGLAACSGESKSETVRIGVVGASDEYWTTFEEAVEAEGIDVELVDFGEYSLPNPALADGELDINQFQHIFYLANHNVQSGDDLTTLGSTAIYPLGLYSTKHDSVADIPEGGKVAIPNDPVNRGRGLLVLQSAGLLKLKDGGHPFATTEDIETTKVEITELDAAQLAPALADVDAAIINNDFLGNAGLTAGDAIAQDDPNDPAAFPYVNVFAVKKGDENNETYKKIVEIYQNTKAVQDGVVENSGGTAVLLKIDNKELQDSLAKTEEAVRNNSK